MEQSKMKIILLAVCGWLFQANTDAQNCLSPTLEHGYLVPEQLSYQHLSDLSYGCDPGLKSSAGSWWGVIKCENGKWSQTPLCIDLRDCFAPEVSHAEPVQPVQTSYPSNSSVTFACDKGYEFETDWQEAVCVDGEWMLPVCSRKASACDAPVHVAHTVIKQPYRSAFDLHEKVEYECKKGYELIGQKISYCMVKVWTREPQCVLEEPRPSPAEPAQPVRYCTGYPMIENGDVVEQEDGVTLEVQCAYLYKRLGPLKVTCVNGQWSELPVCKAPCKLDQSAVDFRKREYMTHGEQESFNCTDHSRVNVTCDNGRAYYTGCGWNEW
uniref:Sushi domain-containing protein n=1 Tax=Astyanax mexicanus TaxID=7994 RepID=W5K343_ASTMX